jgi:hypothetical protein
MSDIRRSNEEQHLRRNPRDEQGKLSGGGGDVTGDEAGEVDEWRELVEGEGEGGRNPIDEVGNAQDAILGTTGMLDDVQRPLYDHERARGMADASGNAHDQATTKLPERQRRRA